MMSILATARQEETAGYLFWLIAMAFAVFVARRTGVFRWRSIEEGNIRVRAGDPVWRLTGLFLLALLIWQLVPVLYLSSGYSSTTRPFSLDRIAPRDMAFLAIVPPMLSFAVLLVGAAMAGRGTLDRLGVAITKLPRGLALGGIGILIVFPLLMWSSLGLEWIYERVGFEHPKAHDLLKVMRNGLDTGEYSTAALLIIAAVIVAPLFEELLFRGYLQTLMLAMVTRLAEGRGIPSYPPSGEGAQAHPTAGMRWIAILGTSLPFMAVHPPWTWPPILLLSLCLGYIYERTGNLWAAITIHCLFNGLTTLLYLTLMAS